MSHFMHVYYEVGKEQYGKKNKESTRLTRCVFLRN